LASRSAASQHFEADERAANHTALAGGVKLFNSQMMLLNQMVLDLAFCPKTASAGPLQEDDRRSQACLNRSLLVADFSRAMLRHDHGEPSTKLHALPPAAVLPHYNNLARSIEAQLVYRALLGLDGAGPAGIPCAPWPASHVENTSAGGWLVYPEQVVR